MAFTEEESNVSIPSGYRFVDHIGRIFDLSFVDDTSFYEDMGQKCYYMKGWDLRFYNFPSLLGIPDEMDFKGDAAKIATWLRTHPKSSAHSQGGCSYKGGLPAPRVEFLKWEDKYWSLQEASFVEQANEYVEEVENEEALKNTISLYGGFLGDYSDITELRAKKIDEVKEKAQDLMEQIIAEFPGNERETFYRQDMEAKQWLANNNAEVPFIRGLAAARGISIEEMVAKITRNTAFWEAASASVCGQRQRIVDQLEAASKYSELMAIDCSITLPVGV